MADNDFDNTPAKDLGWHTMSGEFFLEALRRCYNGENPDLVFAELYANAERESFVEDEDTD